MTLEHHHSCEPAANGLNGMATRSDHGSQPAALSPNLSVLLVRKRTIRIEPMPQPVLERDGVLVRVMANGICGSDMHSYMAGGVAGRPVLEPLVMGHEAAGVVEAVGADVTTHKPGDRVAIEPGMPCRRCVNCKNGRSNICLHMRYCSSPGTHGSLSCYFALAADRAPHIPPTVGWDEAGSIQPLAIGVQIGKRADIRPHQTIAIFGCGPIGLITAAVAHAYSARKIIAFDVRPSRVDFARKYLSPLTGRPIIDHVFHIDAIPDFSSKSSSSGNSNGNGTAAASQDEEDAEETVGDKMWLCAQGRMREIIAQCGLKSEEGVDRVVEASGAQDAILHGVAICKQGGVFLQVGLGHVQTHLVPTVAITNKELDFRGLTRYTASCFPSAIDMLERGVVDLKPLITATFPLSRAQEAFEAVAGGKEIKVIIRNGE
ncbi:sorbitol dehydrogenase [Grosmannia clavigera kw1407]|uniref:D-xylulose reductase n=1 Tax=Grosmannia clavigera (strain kw1407 / UAMH 11150) TaxID=655863 RepID=F0XIB5_GROCL|nr:sorbitol dehydrogenase [Grosmannia clavigera kw1407]EFX02635.1 sorbitol dehydrogenase [Grosmannia clavigera kw1407]